MKKVSKYSFALIAFVFFTCQLFGQEKKEIVLYKKAIRTTYGRYNPHVDVNRNSFEYQWRYIDSSEWNGLGKRYQNIKPVLNQYKISARLLRQSKNVPRYGIILGGTLFVGGIVTTITSFNMESNALIFIGIGASLVGVSTMIISYKLGIKKFERSVDEYNKMVRNDSGSIRTFELGLAFNNVSTSPQLCFQLSL